MDTILNNFLSKSIPDYKKNLNEKEFTMDEYKKLIKIELEKEKPRKGILNLLNKKIKYKDSLKNRDNNINKLNENDLEIFFNKSSRDKNDEINKKRELLLEKIINKDIIINKKKYSNLNKNIHDELKKYCSNTYTYIRCELKAGRRCNYDYDVFYYNNNNLVKQIKLEFKYGVKKITDYPEILQLYCKAYNIFKKKDYIQYFYNNIDNFIEQFPSDISKKLKEYKPNYAEYLKICNDTKYKHTFQNIIYNYSKETNNNISFKKFINQQISDFLKNLKIEDLKFNNIQNLILEKQKGKIFLMICDGNVCSDKIDDKLNIENKIIIKNNNTIVFNSINENYSIQWLLRWKNHKGCSGPAWQISLKYKK